MPFYLSANLALLILFLAASAQPMMLPKVEENVLVPSIARLHAETTSLSFKAMTTKTTVPAQVASQST